MDGWVDLADLIAPRPGVELELATFWSRVRHPTTAPPNLSSIIIQDSLIHLNLRSTRLLYGTEMWDMTVRSMQPATRLRHILQVPLSLFTSPSTRKSWHLRSAQPPVTQTVMLCRRLRFFGHIIRSDSDEDHTRALNAGINDPPKECRRPRIWSSSSNMAIHTVENDLKHQKLGLWSARHIAYDREQCMAWKRGNGNARTDSVGKDHLWSDLKSKSKLHNEKVI